MLKHFLLIQDKNIKTKKKKINQRPKFKQIQESANRRNGKTEHQMIKIVSTFLLTSVHAQTINEWNGTNTHIHASIIAIILPFYKLQIRLINKLSGNPRHFECARGLFALYTLTDYEHNGRHSTCPIHSFEYKYSLFAFKWSHFGLVVRFKLFFFFLSEIHITNNVG